MGREIRRVPSDWHHPRDDKGRFKALYDETFEEASREWWDNACRWHGGDVDKGDEEYREKYPWYWQWNGNPPDNDRYRPAFTSEPTAYQIYETVSEGSPVSPVFETQEEMIAWMTSPLDRSSEYNTGADWQCMQGMTREQAERFCKFGSAPSLIVTNTGGNVDVKPGHLV